jgi:hypothetical protein
MLKICKTYDEDVFEMFKTDEKDMYYNERLEAEAKKRKAYSESRRTNRKNKDESSVVNISKTYDQHMETETETENITITKTEVEVYPTFEDFWDLYDKKTGNKTLIKPKFDKLPQRVKEEILNYLPGYIESTPDKTYRKNPQTFLNNKAWQDELIKYNSNGRQQNNQPDYSNLERILANTEGL